MPVTLSMDGDLKGWPEVYEWIQADEQCPAKLPYVLTIVGGPKFRVLHRINGRDQCRAALKMLFFCTEYSKVKCRITSRTKDNTYSINVEIGKKLENYPPPPDWDFDSRAAKFDFTS